MRRFYIQEMRLLAGKTQEQVADEMGTSTETISRWETGEREPKFSKLERLAVVCNCTPLNLLYGRDFNNNIAKNTLNVKLMQHIIEITLIALAKRAKISIPSEEMAQLITDIYKAAEGEEIANDDKMLEGYIYGRLSGESF